MKISVSLLKLIDLEKASHIVQVNASFFKRKIKYNSTNLQQLNFNGGLVFENHNSLTFLKGSDKTVNVIIDGLAASIASVIAMCGDTVKILQRPSGCRHANYFDMIWQMLITSF